MVQTPKQAIQHPVGDNQTKGLAGYPSHMTSWCMRASQLPTLLKRDPHRPLGLFLLKLFEIRIYIGKFNTIQRRLIMLMEAQNILDDQDVANLENAAEEEPTIQNIDLTNMEGPESSPSTGKGDPGDSEEIKQSVRQTLGEKIDDFSSVLDDPSKSSIEELQAATNASISEFQKVERFGRGASARLSVRNGRLLKALQTKVKAAGMNWQTYAKKNINLSQRTIEKYIKIAEIPNVELHLSLGIERLYLLAGAVDGIESEDPIGQFLGKHEMNFDLTEELDFEDFKRRIDEITVKQKAGAEGIEMATETAAKMVERNIPLTKEILDTAKTVKETGGNTNVFFDKLVSAEPNTNGHPAKNSKKKQQNRMKSFNKLAEEMKSFVKEAKEKKGEILRKIDAKSLDELLVELEALKSILANQ